MENMYLYDGKEHTWKMQTGMTINDVSKKCGVIRSRKTLMEYP
jgi:hypothetical protein